MSDLGPRSSCVPLIVQIAIKIQYTMRQPLKKQNK